MFNIVLVEPEIPQNTGNIARTCAATHTKLHLIRPLGFEISDKYLKRAGLDYWQFVDITYYDDLADFFQKNTGANCYYYTTKGRKRHCDVSFKDGDFLIFGKETKGLPEDLLKQHPEACLRIPMLDETRSLNLSNSVAIAVYEALRQNDFFELQTKGQLHNSKWDD